MIGGRIIKRSRLFPIILILFLIISVSNVTAISAPVVSTEPATDVKEHTATLWGNLTDDGGEDCSCWFEWGTTTAYGNATAPQTVSGGNSFNTTGTVNVGLELIKTVYFNLCTDVPPENASYYINNENEANASDYTNITSVDENLYFSETDTCMQYQLYKYNLTGCSNLVISWYGKAYRNTTIGFESNPGIKFYLWNFTGNHWFRSSAYADTDYNFTWVNVTIDNSGDYTQAGVCYVGIATKSFALAGSEHLVQLSTDYFALVTAYLSPGILYHYRAATNNSNSTTYGSDATFLTKPLEPTDPYLVYEDGDATLTWDKGEGANNTVIERNTSSSWARGAGTEIYNNTASGYVDNIGYEKKYYYQMWSYTGWGSHHQYSNDSCNVSTIVISTNSSTGIEETTGILHGYLQHNGSKECTAWFELGTTTSYGTNTSDHVDVANDTEFSQNLSANIYEYYNTGDDAHKTLSDIVNQKLGQSFTLDKSFTILKVRLKIYKGGSTGDNITIFVSIRNVDVDGKPTGSNLSEGSITALEIGTSPGDWYNISMSPYALSSGQQYIIVCEDNASHANDYFEWWYDGTSPAYDGGTGRVDHSMNNWDAFDGDFMFEIYSTIPLLPGQLYHYRTVANNSNSIAYGNDTIFLTKPYEPVSLTTTDYNHSSIGMVWIRGEGANNTVICRDTGLDPPSTPTSGTEVYNSTGTSFTDSGLNASTIYSYSAWSYAYWNPAQWSDANATGNATTEPEPPQNVTYNLSVDGNVGNLTINWTIGSGANRTVIRKAEGTAPETPDNGTLVYNGTGNGTIDVDITQPYVYRLWSYNTTTGLYSDSVDLEWFAIWLNCYDESTGADIVNWSVFFSNEDGTNTYTLTSCNNAQIINVSECPIGEDITIEFSAEGYQTRWYYRDIVAEGAYYIDAYIPPENDTYVYLITVRNKYDTLIENAYCVFKHYDNLTETYVVVASLYTDAAGTVNLHLIAEDIYKIIVTKTGYETEITDYIPSPSIYTKTIELQFVSEDEEFPELLFEQISWSIEPQKKTSKTNITMWFNITSGNSKLEWFRATLYYWNETNSSLVFVASQNISDQPNGGSISFTTSNTTGKYSLTCYFKKQGFQEYEITGEGSTIYTILFIWSLAESETFGAIPGWIYLLVIVIIIMVTMAALMPFMGLFTGYVGIAIFGFALVLKPGLTIPTDAIGGTISGWLIFTATAIIYTLALFLWSRT